MIDRCAAVVRRLNASPTPYVLLDCRGGRRRRDRPSFHETARRVCTILVLEKGVMQALPSVVREARSGYCAAGSRTRYTLRQYGVAMESFDHLLLH